MVGLYILERIELPILLVSVTLLFIPCASPENNLKTYIVLLRSRSIKTYDKFHKEWKEMYSYDLISKHFTKQQSTAATNYKEIFETEPRKLFVKKVLEW